jgi:hypothetical protein
MCGIFRLHGGISRVLDRLYIAENMVGFPVGHQVTVCKKYGYFPYTVLDPADSREKSYAGGEFMQTSQVGYVLACLWLVLNCHLSWKKQNTRATTIFI